MIKIDFKNKLVIISLSILVAYLIFIVIYFVFSTPRSIEITNFKNIVTNGPINLESSVNNMLYKIVIDNKGSINRFTSATIRDNSTIKSYDENTKVTSVNFIVDLPNIKQSYQVNYNYLIENNSFNSGYPISISCLPKSKLIYGDFKCKDMFNQDDESFNPETTVSSYNLEFNDILKTTLSSFSQNLITYSVSRFVDNYFNDESNQAIFSEKCTTEITQEFIYKCDIKTKDKIIKFTLFSDERNNPYRYTLSYSDKNETFEIK